jgi:hypothetical protein
MHRRLAYGAGGTQGGTFETYSFRMLALRLVNASFTSSLDMHRDPTNARRDVWFYCFASDSRARSRCA